MVEEHISNFKEDYLPKIWPAAKLLLAYVLLVAVPYLLLSFVYLKLGLQETPLIDALSSIITLAFLIYWINRKRYINLHNMFGQNVSAAFYIATTPVILGLGILLSETDNLLRSFLPMPEFWVNAFNSLLGGDSGLIYSFIAVAIVAPVVEEVLFRGIILSGFLKHYSPVKAIVVSALLFGLVHANPWQFTGAFTFGLIAAWLYMRTRVLWLCIYMHALNNSMGYVARILGLNIPGFTTGGTVVEFQPLWFNLLGVLMVSCGAWLLYKLLTSAKLTPAAPLR